MNPLISFMNSGLGRGARIVAGVALITWGLLSLGGTTGVLIAVVGVVFVLAGALDVCGLAPACGVAFSGPKARAGK